MIFNRKFCICINVMLIITTLVMYVCLDGGFAFDRFLAIGGAENGTLSFSVFIRKLVFIFEYICALGIIVMLAYYHNWKGMVGLLCLSLLFLIDSCCAVVYGRPADVFNVSMLIDSAANIKDALKMYFHLICKEGGLTILCFLPIFTCWYLNRNNKILIRGWVIICMMTILFIMYFLTVIFRGGTVIIGFPKGYSFLFGCVTVELNRMLEKNEIVNVVEFNAPTNIKNIILVVDESISFDEMSRKIKTINRKDGFFDFGKTISAANCSATSNYILRKGSQKRIDNSFKLFETKSIFDLAKMDNYSTYYIDAQGVLHDQNVRNYFTNQEIKFIDKVIDVSSMNITDRDRSIPEIVNNICHNDNKNFIFINKVGAHFPYQNHLPANDIVTDKMENYRKVLDRNVIYVINQLISQVDDRTVIFYTSDHGQNFDGKVATHCNSGTSIRKEEFHVPFYIITKNKYIINKIKTTNNTNYNHFYITESIRNLFGKEVVGVPSLFKSNLNSDEIGICSIWGQPIKFFGKEPYCMEAK